MRDIKELIDRLRDEADLCRAETADDIAALLDEAADALEKLSSPKIDYTCPACGQPGLRSIYRPTCTACANEERRKSGEIVNSPGSCPGLT